MEPIVDNIHPDDATVVALARFAGLDLAPERVTEVVGWLGGLMPGIAATNARMAARRDVPPASVYGQPPRERGGERG